MFARWTEGEDLEKEKKVFCNFNLCGRKKRRNRSVIESNFISLTVDERFLIQARPTSLGASARFSRIRLSSVLHTFLASELPASQSSNFAIKVY